MIIVLWLRCLRLIFFFQAEDGIRDKLVTGVQTCTQEIGREVMKIYFCYIS